MSVYPRGLSVADVGELCKLYNYEDEPTEDIIWFMLESKMILDNLKDVFNGGNIWISNYAFDVLCMFDVRFNYKILSIINPNDMKYLTKAELITEYEKYYSNDKGFYSITHEIRKHLKPFNFNLNSTKRTVANNTRVDYYFITFNALTKNPKTYVSKVNLNKPEMLDDIIFYINDKNKVSIKLR